MTTEEKKPRKKRKSGELAVFVETVGAVETWVRVKGTEPFDISLECEAHIEAHGVPGFKYLIVRILAERTVTEETVRRLT
jgi:hypothetical protein